MKKIIFALAMCIFTPSFSQQQQIEIFELKKGMKCSAVQDLFDFVSTQFNEKMMWVGKDASGSYISLYKNEQTGSWTLIQFDSKIGCVLGVGETGSPA
jgi:hypothetical protein